jgi:hypothetical protein
VANSSRITHRVQRSQVKSGCLFLPDSRALALQKSLLQSTEHTLLFTARLLTPSDSTFTINELLLAH